MAPISRLLREPLLHFFVVGSLLFAAYAWFGDRTEPRDDTTIVVDRRALLSFLQYRANAFEEDTFAAALDSMSDAQLQEVVDAYVEEEILYREAKSLALDDSDNIIRQRMIQKMDFVLTDITETGDSTDAASLERYFADNIDAYAVEPWVTFTHVFVETDASGREAARREAEDLLQELNDSGAAFNDAPNYGDRFPFLRNYVERTLEYIAGHFGEDFASEIEAMSSSASRWQGPVESAFGMHLVLLTDNNERRFPTFDAVRDQVARDFADSLSADVRADLVEAIRQRYRVELGTIRTEAAE